MTVGVGCVGTEVASNPLVVVEHAVVAAFAELSFVAYASAAAVDFVAAAVDSTCLTESPIVAADAKA